jgi:hypothetical protein
MGKLEKSCLAAAGKGIIGGEEKSAPFAQSASVVLTQSQKNLLNAYSKKSLQPIMLLIASDPVYR